MEEIIKKTLQYEKNTLMEKKNRINDDSHLFNIIDNYSSIEPKHYLIIYDNDLRIAGFKQEQEFLQSLSSYLRKTDEVTMKTHSNMTVSEIKEVLSSVGNKQLIVLFSGNGTANVLRISIKEKFDISAFPDDTILFTSSNKPFLREGNRKNIIVIGEKNRIIYPTRPKKLCGVFSDLNTSVKNMSETDACFSVKKY